MSSLIELKNISKHYIINKKTVILKKFGQEITVARWTLSSDGKLAPNSVHSLKRSLLRR